MLPPKTWNMKVSLTESKKHETWLDKDSVSATTTCDGNVWAKVVKSGMKGTVNSKNLRFKHLKPKEGSVFDSHSCCHILLWFSRLSQMGNSLIWYWFCKFLTDQTHFGWNGILIFFEPKTVTSLGFNTFYTTQIGDMNFLNNMNPSWECHKFKRKADHVLNFNNHL